MCTGRDDAKPVATIMRTERSLGQGLVEFSLAILVFLVIVFGVVDFGRGIYQFNAVSQSAREIARATSVNLCASAPCVFVGGVLNPAAYSPETLAVIDVQKELVPGLGDPVITCVHQSGTALGSSEPCNQHEDSIKVVVVSPFKPITPPMSAWVQWNLQGSSSAQIQ